MEILCKVLDAEYMDHMASRSSSVYPGNRIHKTHLLPPELWQEVSFWLDLN